jgi:hypothetical protein
MVQSNITYDAPYNRKLVSILREMDEKHWQKSYPQYTPTPMGQRIGQYHGDLSGTMVGGGSSPMMYNPAGNSVAYPPIHMASGLEVSSGGAYAGIDGAVGGKKAYGVSRFVKDLGKIGKAIGIKQITKPIAKAATAKAVSEIEGAALSGGKKAYGVSRFVKDLNKISKAVGLKQFTKPIAKAATKKAVKELDGAPMSDMADVIEETKGGKYGVSRFVKDLNKIGKAVGIKQITKPIAKAATKKAVSEIEGAGRKGGRAERARIVKQVMAEKGLSMIEASKYVKAHGLY